MSTEGTGLPLSVHQSNEQENPVRPNEGMFVSETGRAPCLGLFVDNLWESLTDRIGLQHSQAHAGLIHHVQSMRTVGTVGRNMASRTEMVKLDFHPSVRSAGGGVL